MLTLPGEGLRKGRDDAIAVFFVHARTGGQAQTMLEEAFADFAAVHFGGSENGLEVHGLPDRTGLDILGFEREADLLARDTSNRGIDGQAGEPAG